MNDEHKNLTSYHALGMYRIVSMLTRAEYDLARSLSTTHARSEAVVAASIIVRDEFNDLDSIGLLHLRTAAMETGLPWSAVRPNGLCRFLANYFPAVGLAKDESLGRVNYRLQPRTSGPSGRILRTCARLSRSTCRGDS